MSKSDPAPQFKPITKSDTVDFRLPASVYVGTGGDVVAINADNEAVTFKNVPSGFILPILTKRINETGTAASDMVSMSQ
jgi:hypothetical protein